MHAQGHFQKGMSSVYIIIVIILVAFGITLSGGGGSLFTGNMASPDIPTPTPDPATAPGSETPTIPPSSAEWEITVSLGSCLAGKAPYKIGTATIKGPEKGYAELIVDDPRKVIGNQVFNPPASSYPLTLSNDDGFKISTWKISVYSGGTQTGSTWSGGVLKKVYIGAPTGCS